MLKLLKCQEIKSFKESKDSNPIVIETIQKIYDYSKEKYKKNENKSTWTHQAISFNGSKL